MRANGKFEGLVTGLANGSNVLTAQLPDGYGARLTIVNHPIGGPTFSGPQIQPWLCQPGATDSAVRPAAELRLLLHAGGPAASGGGQPRRVQSYDPSNPPPSSAIATDDHHGRRDRPVHHPAGDRLHGP